MISIIAPIYNMQNRVVPLIKSILRSSFQNFELIFVDDCSKDQTINNILPFLKDKRIKLIKLKKNSGPSKARNVGAKESKFDILFFIDSDIEIFEDTLEVIKEAYSRRKDLKAMIGVSESKPLNKGFFPRYRAILEHSWFLDKDWKKCTFFTPRVGTIKKDVFFELKGFDEKYKGADVEDYEFGYRLSNNYNILINLKLRIKHCFPSYSKNAKNYYERCKKWALLFFKRWKFDNIGTSSSDGLETILQAISPLFIILGFFNFIFWIIFIFNFLLITWLMRKLLVLSYKEEGFVFMFKAFVTRYSLSFFVIAGFFMGFLDYIFRNSKIERVILLTRSYLRFKNPSYLIFFVTSMCNSKCKMCFNWKNTANYKDRKQLTLEEIGRITKNLKFLYHLTLSGGEPVLREDLLYIVKLFYKNSGTRSFTLTTNGILTDKITKRVEEILSSCPNITLRVPLSIDGLYEKHDLIRGVKGNFEKLSRTYKELKELQKKYDNLIIIATTVFSKLNEDHIPEILEYVDRHWKVNNHAVLLVRGNTKEKYVKDVVLKDYESVFKIIDDLNEKKHKKKYQFSKILNTENKIEKYMILETLKRKKQVVPCLAGKKLVILSDVGDLQPCEILSCILNNEKASSMGNVRDFDYDIKKMLKTKKARKILNYIKEKKCYCTFECAMAASIFFNPFIFTKLMLKNLLGRPC